MTQQQKVRDVSMQSVLERLIQRTPAAISTAIINEMAGLALVMDPDFKIRCSLNLSDKLRVAGVITVGSNGVVPKLLPLSPTSDNKTLISEEAAISMMQLGAAEYPYACFCFLGESEAELKDNLRKAQALLEKTSREMFLDAVDSVSKREDFEILNPK